MEIDKQKETTKFRKHAHLFVMVLTTNHNICEFGVETSTVKIFNDVVEQIRIKRRA